MIRRAEHHDLPRLQDIERAAGALFRDIDMATIADDDPLSLAALQTYQADGRAWVATEDNATDEAVAYLLLDVVDEAAHIEQLSVDPSHARQGIGRRLIEEAASWAAEQELAWMTLTTFAEVPWNAPYYARLGFAVVPEALVGPQLAAVRRHERELGLDTWPRVSMRRPVRRQDAAST